MITEADLLFRKFPDRQQQRAGDRLRPQALGDAEGLESHLSGVNLSWAKKAARFALLKPVVASSALFDRLMALSITSTMDVVEWAAGSRIFQTCACMVVSWFFHHQRRAEPPHRLLELRLVDVSNLPPFTSTSPWGETLPHMPPLPPPA
jgi:hypothetical protein